MTVGDRIKKIRTRLSMSQVTFADKIDVSKQTLYKYENNIITNIPSDKIEAVAKLGNVSPAYIMGWDVEASASITLYNVHCKTEEEADLVLSYRELSDYGKEKVSSYTHSMLAVERADLALNAAHARTDIDIPEGIDTSEDDIMDDENF